QRRCPRAWAAGGSGPGPTPGSPASSCPRSPTGAGRVSWGRAGPRHQRRLEQPEAPPPRPRGPPGRPRGPGGRGVGPADAVGPRVAHGGRRLAAARVDEDLMRELTALTDLAPLHQPPALA